MDYEKEIPFGAFDSELMHQEIFIPEGFEATIDGDKIILTRKDSEDEKIRKALIEYFNEQCDMSDWNGVYGYQVVAWLEKQGMPYTKRDVDNAYLKGISDAKNELEKQGEKKSSDEVLKIRQELYQSGYNDGYKHGIEDTKQEWSEEDEKMLQNVLECLRHGWKKLPTDILKYESWLKSIKDRYTWKPSNKQMNALDSTLQYSQVSHNSYEHLNSLYNDLKKLKGE